MDVDARIVGLGVGQLVRYLTPLHAVECLLYDEVPFFRRVFDGTIRYRWRRRNGEEGDHEFMARIGRLNFRRYNRHFPRDIYVRHRISNLDTFAIDAKVLINHALDLGRRGITLYNESSLHATPRQNRGMNAALKHG
jgi:aminoglycoside 3-N-acetyltransferase